MSGAQALATLGKLSYDEVIYLLAVEGKLKRLSTEHAWMHSFLQDAYHQQPQERVARLWIAEVRDLMYQVQDVIDNFNHKVASMRQRGFVGKLKRGVCSLREAWALHDIGLEIDELTTKLADLSRRAQTYGIQRSQAGDDHAIPSNRRQLFQPTSDANDLVGFEGYINELKGALCDENNPHYTAWVVLICGMGGTGKTAFAKKICHHNDVRRHFKSFAWANVSKQFKVKHVLQQIFIQLNSAKDQEKERILQSDEDELGNELSGLLESEKYLVILDDVWEDTDWEILQTIFPDKVRNPGSKILITSRNQEVASKDGRFLRQLEGLDDEHSWELLRKFVPQVGCYKGECSCMNVNYEEKYGELGREMIKECQRLPLAITILGGLLATKTNIHEWKKVAKHIKSYLMRGDKRNIGVRKVLASSYDDLPFYLKQCFLYLGQFPGDHNIHVNRLIQMWIADGLVEPTQVHWEEEDEEIENLARSFLKELVQRCMVLVVKKKMNDEVKTCRLHDMMRDVCLSKAKEENFLYITNNGGGQDLADRRKITTSIITEVPRLAIHKSPRIVLDAKNPHMRSLTFFCKSLSKETFGSVKREEHSLNCLFLLFRTRRIHVYMYIFQQLPDRHKQQ